MVKYIRSWLLVWNDVKTKNMVSNGIVLLFKDVMRVWNEIVQQISVEIYKCMGKKQDKSLFQSSHVLI